MKHQWHRLRPPGVSRRDLLFNELLASIDTKFVSGSDVMLDLAEVKCLIRCMQSGIIDVPNGKDREALAFELVRQGLTLKRLIQEADGCTRGLPGPHEQPEDDCAPIGDR